ncbi:hypothetical protein I5I61_09655 [Pseudomonas nitroreducens]|uniref:Uncharacterized protein n=1 Tax=Pseudomonas nitroreducens TaxID=46680 RepID=A0ABS0KI47_PSENT|nr:hypothetical protein [Pseudomonas nitroreducens]MBG6287708.1 hypothetical protein [Pseudomonas nitroreducens]
MRQATERDFRKPEFMDASVEDYEVRDDGVCVRKDRWEMGVRRLASMVGCSRDFEIPDVLDKAGQILDGWMTAEPEDFPDMLANPVDIRLSCGSILIRCEERGGGLAWGFSGKLFIADDMGADVVEWRRHKTEQQNPS